MAKAKIHIVIADRDELYLNNMANYMMEKAPHFEIFTFSNEESLGRFLAGEQKTDIILADAQTIDLSKVAKAGASLKIVMSADGEDVDGFASVRKFQKTEHLINEILLRYAEATGKTDSVKGNRQTRIAAFYSPIGGSGVTTLALGTALTAASQGIRTCYLNLEDIDSTGAILPRTPGTMSDVYLTLKIKSANAGVKLLSSCGREANTGLSYVTGPDSITDLMEVTGEEFRRLFQEIEFLGEYDMLVIDMGSGFHEGKIRMLEQCDSILMPMVADKLAVRKIQMLLREEELHDRFHQVLEKTSIIINKAEPAGMGSVIQTSGILDQKPAVAVFAFSPAFMDAEKLPFSASGLISVFEPVIRRILES